MKFKGRREYLGEFGSPESYEAFRRFIDAIRTGHPSPSDVIRPDVPDVGELVTKFSDHALEHYGGGDPKSRSEYTNFRSALEVLYRHWADTPTSAFTSSTLEEVQAQMARKRWSRSHINRQLGRIRYVFRWGVVKNLVPASVSQELSDAAEIMTLRKGKPIIVDDERIVPREPEPVQPVDDRYVAATLPFLAPTVAAMVQVQRCTAMRPGEVCQMQVGELDRSGEVWIYQPAEHKNAWRRQLRTVAIPRTPQLILAKHIPEDADAYLFSPLAAMEWHWEQRSRERKTKVQPSQVNRRPECRGRHYREFYTTDSYRQAIRHAVKKANRELRRAAEAAGREPILVPNWTPGQLRHTAADEAARLLSPMAAQHVLGHASLRTTEKYFSQQLVDLVDAATRLDRLRFQFAQGSAQAEKPPEK